tara:strand:- start:789 stop:896 length:108 start_codon:yes stop_codon:yes gene_type:complete
VKLQCVEQEKIKDKDVQPQEVEEDQDLHVVDQEGN